MEERRARSNDLNLLRASLVTLAQSRFPVVFPQFRRRLQLGACSAIAPTIFHASASAVSVAWALLLNALAAGGEAHVREFDQRGKQLTACKVP